MKGKVKFFDAEKKFGFITGEDGKDYYVRKSDLQSDIILNKDDSVEFSVEEGDKGPKAINVKKV